MPPKPGTKSISKHFAPLKLEDSQVITRKDLQFDFLTHLFQDTHKVFTDPNPPTDGSPEGSKICFRDLYVNAIIRSPRASRFLRDKMIESPRFANDFAMISCLINVGRIPTNMAFFTEMKTSLRNYHPVPSLSTTDGNLQDVPRIRLILKSSLLSNEVNNTPSTPSEIKSRLASGRIPSTGVANLLFVFANHAPAISDMHFPDNVDFMDLFMPIALSSASRARALLWLCYHYLEKPDDLNEEGYDNPFADEQGDPDKIPSLEPVTEEEFALQNVDPEEEKAIAEKLLEQRRDFIAQQEINHFKDVGPSKPPQSTPTQKRKRPGPGPTQTRTRLLSADQQGIGQADAVHSTTVPREYDFIPEASNPLPPPRQAPSHQHRLPSQDTVNHTHHPVHVQQRPISHSHSPEQEHLPRHRSHAQQLTSMVQHAVHVANHCDPLADSDGEEVDPQELRQDYVQRLAVLNRLRGRPPTPEVE